MGPKAPTFKAGVPWFPLTVVQSSFNLSTDVTLPTQNCAGISNKKHTAGDDGCEGDKEDRTPAFPLYEGTGENKTTDRTIPACYPF